MCLCVTGKRCAASRAEKAAFDLQLQDLKGGFHPLQKTEISSLQREKQSLMRPLAASVDEMRNLLSYLSQLKGIEPGVARETVSHQAAGTPDIDFERIVYPGPGDWLTYNG